MTPPFRHSGNSRPHVVHHGYQDRCRVPGPLAHDTPEGGSLWLVGVGIAAALLGVSWLVAVVLP